MKNYLLPLCKSNAVKDSFKIKPIKTILYVSVIMGAICFILSNSIILHVLQNS